MAVTAVVMGLVLGTAQQNNLTDEEIKARAAELGMVDESSVLVPLNTENNDKKEEPEVSKQDKPTPTPTPTPTCAAASAMCWKVPTSTISATPPA